MVKSVSTSNNNAPKLRGGIVVVAVVVVVVVVVVVAVFVVVFGDVFSLRIIVPGKGTCSWRVNFDNHPVRKSWNISV